MKGGKVLILDDEPEMLENCQRILTAAGYSCLLTGDPLEAVLLLGSDRPDVVITDLRMPVMDGMDVLKQAREIDHLCPVIVLTAFASIESAIEAVKQGAFDYLSKPFSNEQIRIAVGRAMEQRRLALENLHLREQVRGTHGFENIIGRSRALQETLNLAQKAARSEANVLILGESGTGKELIARAIHANSRRASQPLIPVDCASLPENLLESELFGYEHGAFTGAAKSKPGLIELAHRGTLFLDEIGELLPALQVKLLRVLQERQFRRLGGTRQVEVDVRLVSATNRDLEELVAQNKFRSDLYYRLNVISVRVPPLRERDGDVPLLAHSFLNHYRKQNAKPALLGFTREVVQIFERYTWPGNIRELQNVVEHACALADGDMIAMKDLPEQFASGNLRLARLRSTTFAGSTYKEAKERWLMEFEAAFANEMMQRYGGNLSRAAEAAGVDRKTFRKLLKSRDHN
jgi:two-component system response regulator HydG